MLPSEYTSQSSLDDAKRCGRGAGCRYDFVPIAEGARGDHQHAGAACLRGLSRGLTEENIQIRLRGLLLMALCNKFGEMLLTTGNKSEVAVGYATIYGDMAGGYNPIKDMYKTRVFEHMPLAQRQSPRLDDGAGGQGDPAAISRSHQVPSCARIRMTVISLPDYPVLDGILDDPGGRRWQSIRLRRGRI